MQDSPQSTERFFQPSPIASLRPGPTFKRHVEKFDRPCGSASRVIAVRFGECSSSHDDGDTVIPATHEQLTHGRIGILASFGQVEGRLPDIVGGRHYGSFLGQSG